MRKICTKAKNMIKSLYIKGKPIIANGVKAVYKTIRRLIILVSMLAFFIVPFLNNCIDSFIAHCIWYPAFGVMVILAIQECFRKNELDNEETEVDHVGKWSFWATLFIFLSVFVIRYYQVTYVWLWVIFGVVAIYTFSFFISLLSYELKHKDMTKKEEQKITINVVKYILMYWLFDLMYMGIFNDWFWVKVICGTLAVTFVLYNLVLAFFNISELLKGWLVLELLFGMGAAIYLIYIIENETLRSIIVTIVAAVIGGLFTLIGVAWTIKKGEKERKEDERKRNIPYMKVVFGLKESSEVCACIYEGLDLNDTKELKKVDGNSLYLITIHDCMMKNISQSNIILQGMIFDDKRYDFADPVILEEDEVCKIRSTGNHSIFVSNLEGTLILIVKDIMDNVYSIECKLSYESRNRIAKMTVEEREYVCFEFNGIIKRVKLPNLIGGKI